MSDINSLNKNNTNYVISGLNYIVICDDNANVVAKTATISDAFNLDSNLSFKIKFTKGSTASSPTLNLNNTGAKSIIATTSTTNFVINQLYDCYYNGTNYIIDNTIDSKIGNTITINGYPLTSNITLTQSDLGLEYVDNTPDYKKCVCYAETACSACSATCAGDADYAYRSNIACSADSANSAGWADTSCVACCACYACCANYIPNANKTSWYCIYFV